MGIYKVKEELEKLSKHFTDLGITHVNNCLHWERFTIAYRDWHQWGDFYATGWERPWDKINVLEQTYLLRKIVHGGKKNARGGTIGFCGCHDTKSLYDLALEGQAKSLVEAREGYPPQIKGYKGKVGTEVEKLQAQASIEELSFLLRERIAAMAFTSDAGWYLLSGDEFGHAGRKWVFDDYKPWQENGSFEKKWGGKFDLCDFIYNVNLTLAKLSKPTSAFWAQHVVLKAKPELMIVIRHKESGYENPESTELVIVNLSEKQVGLTLSDINQITEIASYREEKNSEYATAAKKCVTTAISNGNVFLIGPFLIHKYLKIGKSVNTNNASFSKPLLTAVIDGVKLQFNEEWVNPNDDCGFISLGTDRDKLVNALLMLIDENNLEVCTSSCNFLADEIKAALLAEELSDQMTKEKTWMNLLKQQYDVQQKIDDEIRKIKDKINIPSQITKQEPVKVLEWLNNQGKNFPLLLSLLLELKQVETAMLVYCKQPQVVRTYVQQYNNTSLWLGYKTALLFAKAKNINLFIFSKSEDGKNLASIGKEVCSHPTNTIYMVFTAGFTHFNLLIPSSSSDKTTEVKPGKMSVG